MVKERTNASKMSSDISTHALWVYTTLLEINRNAPLHIHAKNMCIDGNEYIGNKLCG